MVEYENHHNTLIDEGTREKDIDKIAKEVVRFDKLIGKLVDFAKRDRETLIIVTSEMERGGLAIKPGSTPDSMVAAFPTEYNTAIMLPVFAYGPGAHLFSGIYENIDINRKMRALLDF